MSNRRTITKKMRDKKLNLDLDVDTMDIKMALFMEGSSISMLYDSLFDKMKENDIIVSKSTFKNMLMDSENQDCKYNVDLRLKIIKLILDDIDMSNIISSYTKKKQIKRRKSLRIEQILKSGKYDKIYEYSDDEVLLNELEQIPNYRNISEFKRVCNHIDKI